jgi:hypothetical protein
MRSILVGAALLAAAMPALADQTVNGVKVPRGAKVEIVFFTAEDCKYCAQWKKESKEDALKWARAHGVAFHEVGKDRIRNPYAEKHFPPEAAFSWQDIKASGKTNFMIPRWIVYADRKPVMSAAATREWGRFLRFAEDVVEARDAK